MTVKEFWELRNKIKENGKHIVSTYFTDRYAWENMIFTCSDEGYLQRIEVSGEAIYDLKTYIDEDNKMKEKVVSSLLSK